MYTCKNYKSKKELKEERNNPFIETTESFMNATDRFEFFLYSHTPEGG